MLVYATQTIILVTLLALVWRRNAQLDLFLALLLGFWSVAVIAIFKRYGVDQVFFYSNDQLSQLKFVTQYIPLEGIPLRLNELISWRYVTTLPVYFVSKLGFDVVLLLKFQQLVYLTLIYNAGKNYLSRNQVVVKWWHLVFFCGPITIFMSTLALRDVALAYFVILLLLSIQPSANFLGLIGTSLLRPHLAVALIVGWTVAYFLRHISKRFYIVSIGSIFVFAYAVGAYSYLLGAKLNEGPTLEVANSVWSQYKFNRFGANFIGLQFLTFDESIVSASIPTLLLSRIIFFDTFFAPLLFVFWLLIYTPQWNQLKIWIFTSFVFFYGLTSQTNWNSSRQNIPFIIAMGLVGLVSLETYSNHRAKSLVI